MGKPTAATPRLAVVDDARFDAHEAPDGGHPECPERLAAARDGLASVVDASHLTRLAPHMATTDELASVHTPEYVSHLKARLSDGAGQLDADTFFSHGSRAAAWLAAGGSAELARTLMGEDLQRGFALLRPPGHHAEPHMAMGFCLLNNIAIAAQAARRAGAKRVAILDWDVHHGNGTQAAFYDDPDVLFVSLHQFPFYPGTGRSEEIGHGNGTGKTINVPLPAGSGPEAYGYAFEHLVLPALRAFSPELVLISAGFDAHSADPLAMMHLDASTYQAMAYAILAQHPRVGFVLEGGYALNALHASVAAVARACLGESLALPKDPPPAYQRAAIARTRQALSAHWPGVLDVAIPGE